MTAPRTSLGVSAIVRLKRSCGYQPIGAVGMVIDQAPNGKHRYWVMFPGMPFARSLAAEDLELVQGVRPHDEWWSDGAARTSTTPDGPPALGPDQMGCAICRTEVVHDPDALADQQFRWRHVDQGAACKWGGGEHPALPNPTRRLRACVEAWPDCHTGGYDPVCCRFPKSCSATVYDPEHVTDDQLEDR